MTGYSLSHYRIEAELGRGGMGIVYRATDTKLNRTVAIKVLPPAALSQEGDRARFFREAQSAAALSHPNVCHVYGVDEAVPVEEGKEPQPGTDARLFIAMEYIEGQTLQDYIKKGPMKLTEAVAVSAQVAEALKAAHAKEIVHRDIKSANVMITEDGVAKVLDFGLAKTNQSTQLTRMGSTMGTVAFMSPEQARGQEVDGRTDLYSLGTMMYEMIAGRLPFDGEYEQAVVYSILNENPEPLTAMRTGVPMQLEWIVNKLLAKDADYRYQSAAGLLSDLKSVDLSGSGQSRRSMVAATGAMPAAAEQDDGQKWWMNRAVWGVTAAVLVFGLALGWMLRPTPSPEPGIVQQLTLESPSGVEFIRDPAISPSGRYWAYMERSRTGPISGIGRLMLHDTRTGSKRQVATDDRFISRIQFSPSGRWLSWRQTGLTYRMRMPSGSPILVDSSLTHYWLNDEEMLRVRNDSLVVLERLSVETRGIEAIEVTGVPNDKLLGTLSRVGESRWFVAIGLPRVRPTAPSVAANVLYLLDSSNGEATKLIEGVTAPHVVGDYTLLYTTQVDLETFEGTVVAQRLNVHDRVLEGIAVDVLPERIPSSDDFTSGGNDVFLRSQNPTRTVISNEMSLRRWARDSGTRSELPFPDAFWDRIAVAPNGEALIAERRIGPNDFEVEGDLYLLDLTTGTENQFTYTFDVNRAPQWSQDGKIYWAAGRPSQSDIYFKNADGTGGEEMVVENADFPNVSTDGKWLAFSRPEGRNLTLWALDLESGQEIPIDTTSRTSDANISPDGRFITYSSSPKGSPSRSPDQRTIVRSFPDPTEFYLQVTQEFSDDPFFSIDGQYLYFRGDDRLQRIGVSTENGFSVTSAPEDVFDYNWSNVRFAQDPTTGDIIYSDFAEVDEQQDEPERAKLHVIFSFSKYLDDLFGDEQ